MRAYRDSSFISLYRLVRCGVAGPYGKRSNVVNEMLKKPTRLFLHHHVGGISQSYESFLRSFDAVELYPRSFDHHLTAHGSQCK